MWISDNLHVMQASIIPVIALSREHNSCAVLRRNYEHRHMSNLYEQDMRRLRVVDCRMFV